MAGREREGARRRAQTWLVAILLLLAASSTRAGAQSTTTGLAPTTTGVTSVASGIDRNGTEEQEIVDRVRSANPAAVAPFREATRLSDAGDSRRALPLLEAAAKLAPDQPDVLRRKAWVLIELERSDEALRDAERAVELDNSVINNAAVAAAHVGRLRAGSIDAMTPSSIDRLLERAYERARRESPITDKLAIDDIGIQLGLETGQVSVLQTWGSRAVTSDDDSYLGHLAMALVDRAYGDIAESDRHIGELKRLGAPPELLSSLRSAAPMPSDDSSSKGFVHVVEVLAALVAIVLVLVGGFALAGTIVSRRALHWLASTDPNAPVVGNEPFRRPYRMLVAASGAVYLLVLPIIALLAAIPGTALIVLMFATGRIAIGLIEGEIKGIIAVLTHPFSRLAERFRNKRDRDLPGRQLERSSAPKLYALLDELSVVVGTRPPDQVRIFPDTMMSVYETRGRSSVRVLNIGVASLIGLDATAFASILCHELGHFRGGDTSASLTGRRVSANMLELNRSLSHGFISVILSRSLKQLWKVHHRVTLGADRIQETLADRIAAQEFGPAAFERGLSHVTRRSIEYPRSASFALDIARMGQGLSDAHNEVARQLRSIYDPALIGSDGKGQAVQREYEQALSAPTTDFDTHPSPKDRFTEVARVNAAGRTIVGSALELFEDPIELLASQDAAVFALNKFDVSWKTPVPPEVYRALAASASATLPDPDAGAALPATDDVASGAVGTTAVSDSAG